PIVANARTGCHRQESLQSQRPGGKTWAKAEKATTGWKGCTDKTNAKRGERTCRPRQASGLTKGPEPMKGPHTKSCRSRQRKKPKTNGPGATRRTNCPGGASP